MTVPFANKAKWRVPHIVIFNPTNRALGHIELGEVLRPRGFRIAKITDSLAEAFAEIVEGKASFLVIDDAPTYPAVIALRGQLFHVLALLTPTIVLWNPAGNEEKSFILRHALTEVLNKPFSPLGFLSCFDKMIHRCATAPFSLVRSAGEAVCAGDTQKAFSILTSLSKQGPAVPIAASALALFHRSSGNDHHAEKVLLKGVSMSSFSVALHVHLINLYMSLGMPMRALFFIEQLNDQYLNPNILNIDAMQVHLLLNNVKMASSLCRNMILKGFMEEEARKFLPRLYFSAGMREDFDAAIGHRPAKFMQYDKAWYGLDNETAEQRRKIYEINLPQNSQRSTSSRGADGKPINSPKKTG